MTHGISWFGSVVVAAELLRKSKDGKEGDESFANKMARDNFNIRAKRVRSALNRNGGANAAAAAWLQKVFFTDVSHSELTIWLTDAVGKLGNDGYTLDLSPVVYGDLDFAAAVEQMPIYDEDDDEEEEEEGEEEEEEWQDD